MYQGGCLCGIVRFEISGSIQDIVYCHCSLCRKAQGSAFATNGNVDAEAFVFVSGEGELTAYESTLGQSKYFCRRCGSPIMSKQTIKPDVIRVRLGTIDSAITERPEAHIFVSSRANWENCCEELPQYRAYTGEE